MSCRIKLGALRSGIAWLGGFIAGSNFGAAWREASKRDPRTAKKSPWTVDDRGFDTVTEAREAAGAALRALDGKARGRLDVVHGLACLQVTGSLGVGFVCHRTANASDERLWAVLVRGGLSLDDSTDDRMVARMDVPMGDATGSVPVPLVNDVASVELALDDFFENPGVAASGPQWVTGGYAEGSRLSTR